MICSKPKGSCKFCPHHRYDEEYMGYACYAEHEPRYWTEITPAADAVILPKSSSDERICIIYLNECANNGNGSFEIEYCDAERILQLAKEVNNDSKSFFELLPDRFQGEWYYCDNVPDTKDSFEEWVQKYFDADFIVGRDGDIDDELWFLTTWAKMKLNPR